MLPKNGDSWTLPLKNLTSHHGKKGKKINEKNTTLIFLPPKPYLQLIKAHKHNPHSLFICISLWLHWSLNSESWTVNTELRELNSENWTMTPEPYYYTVCTLWTASINSVEKHCSFHPAAVISVKMWRNMILDMSIAGKEMSSDL